MTSSGPLLSPTNPLGTSFQIPWKRGGIVMTSLWPLRSPNSQECDGGDVSLSSIPWSNESKESLRSLLEESLFGICDVTFSCPVEESQKKQVHLSSRRIINHFVLSSWFFPFFALFWGWISNIFPDRNHRRNIQSTQVGSNRNRPKNFFNYGCEIDKLIRS